MQNTPSLDDIYHGRKTATAEPSLDDIYNGKAAPTAAQQLAPEQGDFMRGLSRTLPEAKQLTGGSLAYLGDVTGIDSLKDYGLGVYKRGEEASQALQKDTDSFTAAKEKGVGGLIDFAQNAAGYVTGQALETGAAALGGALIGTAAEPGGGTIVGGIAGAVGKQGAKKLVKEAVKDMVAKQISEGVAKNVAKAEGKAIAKKELGDIALRQATKAEIKSGASKIGGAAALGASNINMELGSIYGTAVSKAEEDGKTLTPGDKARILFSALGAAGVETLTDQFAIGKVLDGVGADKFVRRAFREIVSGAGREGSTEALQTGIERFGAGQDLTSEEAMRDYVDSAAVGALGGGLFGGASSFHKAEPKQKIVINPVTQEKAEIVSLPVPQPIQAPIEQSAPTAAQQLALPAPSGFTVDSQGNAVASLGNPVPEIARDAQLRPLGSGVDQPFVNQSRPAIDLPADQFSQVQPEPTVQAQGVTLDSSKGALQNAYVTGVQEETGVPLQSVTVAKKEHLPFNDAGEVQPTTKREPADENEIRQVLETRKNSIIDSQSIKIIAAQLGVKPMAVSGVKAKMREEERTAAKAPRGNTSPADVTAANPQKEVSGEILQSSGQERPSQEIRQSSGQEIGGQANGSAVSQEVVKTPAVAPVAQPVSIDDSNEVLDDDITNTSGEPFTVEGAAKVAANRAGDGFVVVPVDGGFVVRKIGVAETSQAAPTQPNQIAVAKQNAKGIQPSAPVKPKAKREKQAAISAPSPNTAVQSAVLENQAIQEVPAAGQVENTQSSSENNTPKGVLSKTKTGFGEDLLEFQLPNGGKVLVRKDDFEGDRASIPSYKPDGKRIVKGVIAKSNLRDINSVTPKNRVTVDNSTPVIRKSRNTVDKTNAAPAEERRTHAAERAKIDQLPVEDQAAEIAKLREQLAAETKRADTDTLTGTKSATAYRRDLKEAKAVASIDLTLFKGYNTILTEQGGDAVLTAFGKAMERVAPGKAYRRGGDEFAFLSDTAEQAQSYLDALTSEVDKIEMQLTGADGTEYTVTGVPYISGVGNDEKSANTARDATKTKSDRNAVPPNVKPKADAGTVDEARSVSEVDRSKAPVESSSKLDDYLSGKTILEQGRIKKTLGEKVRLKDGRSLTRQEIIESRTGDGWIVETEQEDKIKPMSRLEYFRADNAQQLAHEKKVKAGGKVTVYWLNKGDQNYKLTKTEADYAGFLADKPKTGLFSKPDKSVTTKITETPAFKALSDFLGSTSIASDMLSTTNKSDVDSLKRDAEALSDLLERHPFGSKPDGGVNVPSAMATHVFDMTKNNQVIGAIVRSIPVDVMDFFAGKEFSAETVLRDKSMLEKMLSVDSGSSVTLNIGEASAFIRSIASTATKLSDLADRALKADAALLANNNDSVLGAHAAKDITKTESFSRWFGDSKVVDAAGKPLVVYHGTKDDITAFDSSKTVDGGFHFGTSEQANMRVSGSGKKLVPVYISAKKLQRSKDLGGNWKGKIRSAKNSGADGIVYLNRFEGLSTDVIQRLDSEGLLNKIDSMSDSEFKKAVPEAKDSYIVFSPTKIKSATDNSGSFDAKNPNIFQSRQEPGATNREPIGAGSLQRRVDRMVSKWRGNIPTIKVVQEATQLPDIAKRDAGWFESEGFYDGNKTIWLVAHNLGNIDRAMQVLAHETFGHYGVESVVGKDQWAQIVSDVQKLRSNTSNLSPAVASAMQSTERRYGSESPSVFAREFIAVMAEKGVKSSLVGRMLAALRKFLRKFNFRFDRWSEAELREILAKGIRNVTESGKSTNRDGVARFSAKTDTFYSALANSVQTAKGAPIKADAEKWKQWLDGAQARGEFKKEERDWIGIDAWLAENESVTRQQLADFVRANQVQVTETVLGDDRTDLPEGWRVERGEGNDLNFVVYDENDDEISQGDTRAEAISNAQDFDERQDTIATGGAKFSQYQLPGGKNYRELLLTLPARKDADPTDKEISRYLPIAVWKDANQDKNQVPSALWDQARRDYLNDHEKDINTQTDSNYRSSHFDQPNIVAHVRFNERTDADGKKVLFLEEIQGDWPQAMRKSKLQVVRQVKEDFDGIVKRMENAGVLEVNCD